MQIDDDLILYIEDLSHLTLSKEERARLKADLGNVLSRMARLDELDTDGIPECSHPFDDTNAFREDEVKPSLACELLFKNAPKHNGEMFLAPKTVE